MTFKQKVLHPAYYENFTCIGGACEDNCCKGWRITIDKKTYLDYRKIRDPKFVENFSQRIKRIRDDTASDSTYAEFILDEEKACPYQLENGLCEMYIKQGPQYLCVTCQTYPRMLTQVVPEMIELSLSMSCPEAVRLGVLQEKPMSFAFSEMEFERNEKFLRATEIALPKNTTPDQAVTHAWNVREACIDILQYKGNSLPERLLVIGMLLKKADALVQADKAAEISALAAAFRKGVQAGEFTNLAERFERNEAIEKAMASTLHANLVLLSRSNQQRYLPFSNVFSDFMDNRDENDPELAMHLHQFIEKMAGKHWQGILATHGQAIENALVNYVFSTIFPFKYHRELSIYHHFVLLVEQYAMLRIALCHGQENGGLDEPKLTKVFTSLAHFAQHSQSSKRILELYRALGNDSLAHMSFLLR